MTKTNPQLIVWVTLCIAALAARLGAQPPNDDCLAGTVIPGTEVTYTPPLAATNNATGELCGAPESCETGGVGTSNSVWYSYVPDQDGRIGIDTFGSTTYDTVVSVFDGCGRLNPQTLQCTFPNELACNDNSGFGTLSQVYLDVSEGQTYRIKVADQDQNPGGGLLEFHLFYYPPNEICSNATVVDSSSYDPPLLNTDNAVIGLCEAQESCESSGVGVSNTVWYSVTSLTSGYLSIDTNGTNYDTVVSVFDGCREFINVETCGVPPTEIDCDDDSGIGLSSMLVDVPIQSGTTYLIKVSDYDLSPGGGALDFNLSFSETPINPNIFADGFESGDTSVWSSTSP